MKIIFKILRLVWYGIFFFIEILHLIWHAILFFIVTPFVNMILRRSQQEPDDFDEILAFLASEDYEGVLTDVCTLEGFLTCIAIGPKPISTEEWHTVIIDETMWRDKGEEWISLKMGSLALLMEDIEYRFDQDPASYRPLFETHPELCRGIAHIPAWCHGFMIGTMVRDLQWRQVNRKGKLRDTLTPIYALAEQEGLARVWKEAGQKRPASETDKQIEIDLPQLKAALQEIHSYWSKRA